MPGSIARHLIELGLPLDAARVYEVLLDAGSCTRAHIAERLGMSRDSLYAAVAELQGFAMVSCPAEGDGPLAPLEPTAGLSFLALRRQADLAVRENATCDAYGTYRRNFGIPAPSAVEIVAAGDVQIRVAELERSAVHRIRTFDTPPYGAPTIENDIETANLARGVSYQVLYVRSAIENAQRYQRNVLPCILAGEEARVLPEVPAKMMIVDDRLALVSLTDSEADAHHSALLVRWCSLLPALTALFEMYWRSATPFSADERPALSNRGAERLRPVERQLISLLAAGVTDEVAARNLGVSRRTVTRHVERLMDLTGTSSRFQLALKAKAAGWTP